MYSNNSIVEQDIEQRARSKANFLDHLGAEAKFNTLMKMKVQLDSLNKNNQRPAKELAILYRRFVIAADETVVPALHPLQF